MNVKLILYSLLWTITQMTNAEIISQNLINKKLSILKIPDMHHIVFKNLQLCYECEFGPITHTYMTVLGDYNQDDIASYWSNFRDIYIFYIDNIPAGFCVVNHGSMIDDQATEVHYFAEYYITPIFRENGYGTIFAHHIIKLYPGLWEIRQLPEKEHAARQFWLKVIYKLEHSNFQEITDHPNWKGVIQKFTTTNT